LFASPPEKDLEWNDQGVEGCFRFLNRVWRLVYENLEVILAAGEVDACTLQGAPRQLRQQVHKTIRKVTEDIDGKFHFNTAIAAIMELVNALSAFEDKAAYPEVVREAFGTVVRLLSPFVPHFAEELWLQFGHEKSLADLGWPNWDEEALVSDTNLIVVQVNGKVRGKVTVPVDADNPFVEKMALEDVNVMRYLEGKTVRKVIVVPGRLVNVVVS
jgi:leucyl-tRNA synthetase